VASVTTGFSHVCVHPQLNLLGSSQKLPVGHGKLGGKVMTEVVIAALAFLSVGAFSWLTHLTLIAQAPSALGIRGTETTI
jgi:hypothetical protein